MIIFFADLRRGGEIGRRTGLKIQRTQVHAGSIPAPGTIKDLETPVPFFIPRPDSPVRMNLPPVAASGLQSSNQGAPIFEPKF